MDGRTDAANGGEGREWKRDVEEADRHSDGAGTARTTVAAHT